MFYEGSEWGKMYPARSYCESLEKQFVQQNISFDGHCYYFGYDVQAVLEKDGLSYVWVFHRHQMTRRGILLPQNAVEYTECWVFIRGLDPSMRFSLRYASSFMRLWMSDSGRGVLPHPYTSKGNISSECFQAIVQLLKDYPLRKLSFRNGELSAQIFGERKDPFAFMNAVAETFSAPLP